MEPTIVTGQTLGILPLAYGIEFPFTLGSVHWVTPNRGDIVLVQTTYRQDFRFYQKFIRFFIRMFLFGQDIFFLNTGPHFSTPGHQVRRVIGIPGDTIEFRLGEWFIRNDETNNEFVSEFIIGNRDYRPLLPEVRTGRQLPFGDSGYRITLNEGEYFLAADNRQGAMDSRHYGSVSLSNIKGKVIIRYLPLADFQRF